MTVVNEGNFGGGRRSLTAVLEASGSPLRSFLAQRLPNTKGFATRYRQEAGPLRVPAADEAVNTGTLGAAFDWLVRFLVHPDPGLAAAAYGAARRSRRTLLAVCELANVLGCSSPVRPESGAQPLGVEFAGPRSGSVAEPETLARGCWALALLTELYRGVPVEASPLARVDLDMVDAQRLLRLAPAGALDQLAALRSQAEDVLTPALGTRAGRWTIGPRFAGSELIAADADLVVNGTLVEIKTSLGDKRPDGTRYAKLERTTLFQLISYALLDFDDHYAVRELLLFQARYGYVAVWDLQDVLDELAGQRVDLASLREEFAGFLRAE